MEYNYKYYRGGSWITTFEWPDEVVTLAVSEDEECLGDGRAIVLTKEAAQNLANYLLRWADGTKE